MTPIARSSFWTVLVLVMASTGLRAQETYETRGLEVDDPGRLSVSLIPGLGLDHEIIERAVREEFARAGVEMTDPRDPADGEVLVIWTGETDSAGGDREGWSTFSVSNIRFEFWRPVRYQATGEDLLAPGITWVMRGTASGGYAPGWTRTEAACGVVSQNLRHFLTLFLKANGRWYAPPESPPAACEGR